MFISHMIGPVAQSARQDQQRSHAAERRAAQAREANAGESISRETATLAWLASIYLPPIDPVAIIHRQDQISRRRNTIADGASRASAATTWLSRIVNWLSDRRTPTAAH